MNTCMTNNSNDNNNLFLLTDLVHIRVADVEVGRVLEGSAAKCKVQNLLRKAGNVT